MNRDVFFVYFKTRRIDTSILEPWFKNWFKLSCVHRELQEQEALPCKTTTPDVSRPRKFVLNCLFFSKSQSTVHPKTRWLFCCDLNTLTAVLS